MVDLNLYKVGEVESVEDNKNLKVCQVNLGGDETLTVVTKASNVRQGSRVAVAPIGSTIRTPEGEELEVKKTTVGGVVSQGILCDSNMLGWTGGAAGIAVQMPPELEIGSAPPSSKPRPKEATSELPESTVEGLFAKKLSKEEKKRIAEEKRKARKAAKEAKNAAEK